MTPIQDSKDRFYAEGGVALSPEVPIRLDSTAAEVWQLRQPATTQSKCVTLQEVQDARQKRAGAE